MKTIIHEVESWILPRGGKYQQEASLDVRVLENFTGPFFHQSTSAWGGLSASEHPGRNFEGRLAVPTLCKGMGAAGEVGDGKSKAGLATGRKKR
jgi:hypothetical protein